MDNCLHTVLAKPCHLWLWHTYPGNKASSTYKFSCQIRPLLHLKAQPYGHLYLPKMNVYTIFNRLKRQYQISFMVVNLLFSKLFLFSEPDCYFLVHCFQIWLYLQGHAPAFIYSTPKRKKKNNEINKSSCLYYYRAKTTTTTTITWNKVYYYKLNSLSLFWLAESVQWIF